MLLDFSAKAATTLAASTFSGPEHHPEVTPQTPIVSNTLALVNLSPSL